ncbi:hypothetical protein GCM10007388_44630 [Pseudoduganella plicata]|uniref:Ankyrin repeat domain-containing protein n=1 Tax=Pseudoduganella plicata TaxID=321984 RepID=A0AA87YBI4_9BURK|nr:hypothetical protein GCM10007388_44630 [Pseudoduganella plicata]
MLDAGDVEALKAVFESCDVNARGGYSKQTALAFNELPDELVRWLVGQGADISALDSYGLTPLHARASHWQGSTGILLELGADVHATDKRGNTALHKAAAVGNLQTARILLQHGARVDAVNDDRLTPMAFALQQCGNVDIEKTAAMARLLLEAHSSAGQRDPITDVMRELVQRIGTEFEFHRSNFNPDSVAATSAALNQLYTLFGVAPVPHRVEHDGKSPIIATAPTWQGRHQQLWELLVPSGGAAGTLQGEVIRLSGRIFNELDGNGGINWDAQFRQMATALLTYLGSGEPLPAASLDEAAGIVDAVKKRSGDTERLCELAEQWVALNPTPTSLAAPAYTR